MRWITVPLLAAAVGGTVIAIPEGRSALATAAVITPMAAADAPVPVDAPPAEAPAPPPTPAAEEPPAQEPPPEEPPVEEPAEQPPAEQPPAEQPPVDEAPPATEPPATERPVTEPPSTEPPATEPPATQPPATEPPPVSEPPATQPPATEPPSADPPATEPPATQPPASDPSRPGGQPDAPQQPAATAPTAVVEPASEVSPPTRPRSEPELVRPDVPAPVPVSNNGDGPLLSSFVSGSVDGLGGMSPVAADAYLGAERWAEANLPACDLDASFLAGLGHVESGHGTTGGVHLLGDGTTSGPIRDEHGGEGPMRFTPSEWARYGSDGNEDGLDNPDNIYDASVAAARKLCAVAGDLPGPSGSLASAADRHRVAYAFVQGAEAPYVVDALDTIHGDEFADEVIRFADSITAKLHAYGVTLEDADRRIAHVVTWMREQIQLGAKYAATNPGRFGTPWDGVRKKSFMSDRTYQYPVGTITYDCSGLMVVGFRQVGIDLMGLGASWTGGMLANLPRVSREQMQVGDLIILGHGGRTTHVVMYLGPDRYIHAGSCGDGMGVCEREGIDWGRVLGVVRVPPDAISVG